MVSVDEKIWADYPGGSVFEYGVRDAVVQTSPVCECVGPDVSAEEVLTVDGGGYIGENGLNVAFDGILPLLVWSGAFVAALVVFIELIGFN